MNQDHELMDDGAFWDRRYSEHGHTGWADDLVYRYDQPLRIRAIKRVLTESSVRVGQGTSVLDVGCGTGDFIAEFAVTGAHIKGIDVSPKVVAATRNRFVGNSNVEVAVGHVQDLRLPDESFDLVTSITVLQHILDRQTLDRALGCIAGLLKPTGRFLALEYAPLQARTSGTSYVAERARTEWRSAFEAQGLSIVRESSYPQFGIVALSLLQAVYGVLRALVTRGPIPGESTGGGGTRQGRWRRLVRKAGLTATYPIDHLLALPTPSSLAPYRIFVLAPTLKPRR